MERCERPCGADVDEAEVIGCVGSVVGVHPVVFEYIWGGVELLSVGLGLGLEDGPREMPIFDV